MRTVQIYVGRDVTDLDCIRVTFTIDGVSQIVDVPMTGMENDKPKYEYNTDLSQGDYIATENGRRILTESNDVFITENSVFTPSIEIYWDGSQWNINIIVNGIIYPYCSDLDIYYPFINNWQFCTSEGDELDYLLTEQCKDLKYERLELFNDEKINLTLSVQNLSDISKTFTDFSQSFTVPGSVVNNRIFEHFYQNDVDGTLDYNIKRPAYIEIDFIPFRKGVVMLEKANLKNGLVDNYSISFFGQLTNLKDIFGEVKINQLDFSDLNFSYTGANVLSRITNTTTDFEVRFPLIANNRLWTYADAGADDITLNANAINYTELFPAVKLARIFNEIEQYFGISFISEFFSDAKFTNLFLEAKNAEIMSFISELSDLVFDQIINTVGPNLIVDPRLYIDIPNSSIKVFWNPNQVIAHIIAVNILSVSGTATIYFDVYINGVYNQTIIGNNTGVQDIYIQNATGLNSIYTFKVRASSSVNVDFQITYVIQRLVAGVPTNYFSDIQCFTTAISGDLNVSSYLPDIKIADLFSSTLKQFNLTCVGIDQNTFQIEPLEDWYNDGAVIDVSKYIDSESIDVARVPLYRNINFKYQKSESFTNRQYFGLTNTEYGNTNNVFNYDSGDFTIDLPFENLLFTRSVGSSGQEAILGYFLNENYQSYIPKPTLLYFYGSSGALTTNIKFYNGSGYNNITSYALFGQDITVSGTKYSLNFGADNSIIHKETIQNGLFATYYFSYLSNLYNLKQRLTTYKSMLPLSILTSLRLNDRLIIRDKRYIINDVKVELTTGEATLTMYNDFRQVDLGSLIIVEEPNTSVSFDVKYRSGNTYAIVSGDADSILPSPLVQWEVNDYSDKNILATYSSLPSPLTRLFTIEYGDGSKTYIRIKQV